MSRRAGRHVRSEYQYSVHPKVREQSLCMNFFRARFPAPAVSVWVGAWQSRGHAEALRQSISGLMTWRDQEDTDRLYCWHPEVALAEAPHGFTSVTVALDENPRLFQRLLDDAVGRQLSRLGFRFRKGGYVNLTRKNVLAEIPALSESVSEKIGIYAKLVIDFLFTKNASNELVHGLIVDVHFTTKLEIPVSEWIAADLEKELYDSYVVLLPDAPEAGDHPELADRLLGRMVDIRDGRAVLSDCRAPGLTDISLDSIAPEATRRNLELYLDARYQKNQSSRGRIQQKLDKLLRPKERLRLIDAVVMQRLLPKRDPRHGLSVLPDLNVQLERCARIGNEHFPCRVLTKPDFSFDQAGDKLDNRIDSGLINYGPYDSEAMGDRAMRVLVVAPRKMEGGVRSALGKIRSGIRTREKVFAGLKRMYRLSRLELIPAWADVSSLSPMSGYAEAIKEAIEKAATSKPFDLVLTVLEESHAALPTSENPYYQTKALVLTLQGIPTQAIHIETLQRPDKNLQYVLNNLCLACYAKTGRTSHVLRLTEAEDPPTELVFGVGRSVTRRTRLGEAEETIGFATVFRANGEYLYHDATPTATEKIILVH